jgi:hypothetical protein
MRKFVLVSLTMTMTACVHTSMQRTGARYPALPDNCPVEYVTSTSSFNAADYETLGHVMLNYDGLTDAAKRDLQPTVCEWGGTAVTIMSSAAGAMGTSATMFVIHRKRDAAATGVAAAEGSGTPTCAGKYVNAHGGIITFEPSGKAKMAFSGNTADCAFRMGGGDKFTMSCQGAASSRDGSFAADCEHMNLGGLEFARSK